MSMPIIHNPFARNRAEEMGVDLWDDFIIPPYFDRLNFIAQKKPFRIIGGRGCGKTTLLRYLSHKSQLSPKRARLDPSAVAFIGLYYRADTQYLSAFSGASIEPRRWQSTFEHALCLALAEELLDVVRKLVGRPMVAQELGEIVTPIQFVGLTEIDPAFPNDLEGLFSSIRRKRVELAVWLNNIETEPLPRLYPLKTMLYLLIEQIKTFVPFLKDTVFNVFIDEYENLLDAQQRLVNTFIKHSEVPLAFHVAIKRNGMRTTKTVGHESIQEEHDYRSVDLEGNLSEHFPLFAAELMFFRLIQEGLPAVDAPIDREVLRDREKLSTRLTDEPYREKVLAAAKRILPSVSAKNIAAHVIGDEVLRKPLIRDIETGLKAKGSKVPTSSFISDAAPEASVTCAALVNQESKDVDTLLSEFDLAKTGAKSKFQTSDWTHHYLHGVLFSIYARTQRPCLLYAGFDSFAQISRLNVRHFLELCNLSISKIGPIKGIEGLVVPPEDQAAAAREASSYFFNEITGSGDYGNRLYSMVATLGQLFRLSQDRPSHSEPERTHFSIIQGDVPEGAKVILDEAVKWSVLFDSPETKVKSVRLESSEYVLNPIYAPQFKISYRKGRRIELSTIHANALLLGDQSALANIIDDYKRNWFGGGAEQPSLLPDD
jgi:hypothetical protein